jgi:hypothetical protein
MKAEGRLVENSDAISNFSAPNFRTTMPLPVLLRGLSQLLADLYEPKTYFQRALRSLDAWQPRPGQKPKYTSRLYDLRILAASLWTQGCKSSYRREYWAYLGAVVYRYHRSPAHIWMGFSLLLSAQHFLVYSRHVSDELARDCAAALEAADQAADQAGEGRNPRKVLRPSREVRLEPAELRFVGRGSQHDLRRHDSS